MNRSTEEPNANFVPVSETLQERAERARQGPIWSWLHLGFLAGVTIVAAALRLVRVEVWSASGAEARLWQYMLAPVGGDFSLTGSAMRLFWGSGLLPGRGEGYLRLPFVFSGIVAVPLLALLAEPFVGRRPALFAAALLAVHPFHVEQSQTASGEVIATTLGLFALGALYAAVAMRRLALGVLAALCLGLAGLSHPTGWLLLHAALGVYCWHVLPGAEGRERIRVGLWLALVLALTVGVAFWRRTEGAGGLGAAAGAIVDFGREIGPTLLVLAAGGAWLRPRRDRGRLAAIAFATPAAVLVLLGITALPLRPATGLFLLPPLLVAAADAAVWLFEAVRRALGGGRRIAVLVPAVLALLAAGLEPAIGTFLYATARRGSRPDWRAARDAIVRTTEQNRFAVLAGAGFDSLMYYLRPNQGVGGVGDPHPGIVVAPYAARVGVAPFLAYAADHGSDLFLALREAEAREFAAANGKDLAAFRLVAVLPCAGESGDDAVVVYRWHRPE